MKKVLIITAVLLLSLTLLWGCGEKDEVAVDVPLYYNLDKGAELTAGADGAYTVNFMLGTEKKTYKITDETLLARVLSQDFLGLTLEGDTVTGMTTLWDMPYHRVTWDYYVQSIGGNSVKLNSSNLFAGDEVLLELPEDLVIYDFAPLSSDFGSPTQLQKNDRTTVIADANGNLKYVFVTDRAAVLGTEQILCQHCQSEVLWYSWLSETDLPTASGHYILSKDIALIKPVKLGSAEICLDLNGKTVTQTSFGRRLLVMQNGGTLSIMDSVGGARMIPASTDDQATEKWGMLLYITSTESTVNFYSGTLDASNCTAQYGCAVNITAGTLNMYGGEILGGNAYGTGGSAITAAGNFNMYGGTLVGGKIIDIGFDSINEEGGATLRVSGLTTIYGGTIIGGESPTNGGAIRVSTDIATGNMGKLILKGGTITGGKAPTGGGIYVTDSSSVTISGNVKITGNECGNLWLNDLAMVYIGDEGLGEEAEIGISMTKPGIWLSNVPAGTDVTAHFKSDTSLRLQANGDGSWSLK